MPVLMILLLVAVQFVLWMHANQVVQLAASEGDRTARVLGGGPAAGALTAHGVLGGPGSDVATSTVTVSVLPGDAELVRVSGRATSVLPWTVPTGQRQRHRADPTVPELGMSRCGPGDRGSLTVELVILAPVVLLVVLATLVFGRVSEARQQVVEASRGRGRSCRRASDRGHRPVGRIDQCRPST